MRQVLMACAVLALVAGAAGIEAPAALRGLDPVLLAEGTEVAGKEAFSASHGRFRYVFASAQNKARFEAEPQRYAIQLDGACARMQGAEGSPDRFYVHEGRIYIFGSEACLKAFQAEPALYLKPMSKRNVAIVLYQGVELLDFTGPGEVFWAAAESRAFDVYTVAQTSEPVRSGASVVVTPRYTIADSPQPHVVVIPGGNAGNAMNPEMIGWIRKVSKEAEVVLSVCNGALVLAKAGLLDGLEATTHQGSIEALRNMAPKTVVHADRRFVDNGRVITSAGISAGIDASLHVVARLLSKQAAVETARYMEYAWQPEAAAHKPAGP